MTFLRWYWHRLKSLPAFTAGYVVGGIVVGVFIQAPAVAWHVLAVVR